jgi:hypothetical protein
MKQLKVKNSLGGGHSIFAIDQSDTINSYLMAAGVARSATVPAGATRVKFSVVPQGTDFYVNDHGTAAVNAGDVSNGSASEPNPGVRTCAPGSTISLISSFVCKIYLAYYS